MERTPARQRIIRDLKNDDLRIQITGKIKDLSKSQLVLDDTTGSIKVDVSEVDCDFSEGDLINVIGDLEIKTSGEKLLKAQFVQDMRKLNFKYYLKLYELKKEVE